jgi:N-acetylglucosamine transport system permease protein
MVLLSSAENRTLPLGIADLAMNQNYQADWSSLFAGMVWVMLPVIIVYWIFRERIQQAMLAGAIKG